MPFGMAPMTSRRGAVVLAGGRCGGDRGPRGEATHRRGVWHYVGDTWTDHTSDDGLASDETWSVAVYHVWQLITTDHTVWAATANGLTAGEVTPPNQRQ